MADRFRGYLPIAVDVETGGFDVLKHALLEIAAVPILIEDGEFVPGKTVHAHVEPFEGALIDPKSLAITGIVIDHPFRFAKPEREALDHVLGGIRKEVKSAACQRAILIGHNAHFDLGVLNAAVARTSYKRNPFHPFSCFDTVSLAGLAYGQTVLARACDTAGLGWDAEKAHSAVYDAEQTARLFCEVLNLWTRSFGMPRTFAPEATDDS